MGWRTVVVENSSKISYKNGYLLIRSDEMKMIHLSEIDSLIISTTQAYITAYALCELWKCKIRIVFCDEKHNPYGELHGLYGSYNTSKKVLLQTLWPYEIKSVVWQIIIKQKISHQLSILEKIGAHDNDIFGDYPNEILPFDISNREGLFAKYYFRKLFGKDFLREVESPTNAALNFGYTVLLSMVNREVVCNGCITQLGIKHSNQFNPHNLSCDIMEPFRPYVDFLVYQLNPKTLDKEIKYKLIDISNIKIQLDQEYYLINALKQYVSDVINCMNTMNTSLVEKYIFKI